MSKVLLVNTQNVPALKDMVQRMEIRRSELSFAGTEYDEPPYHAFGLPIYDSPNYPLHPRRWVFPKEAIWQYGPEVEVWCRYFGIGQEEEVTDEIWIGMSESAMWSPIFGEYPMILNGQPGYLRVPKQGRSDEEDFRLRIRSRLWPEGKGVQA